MTRNVVAIAVVTHAEMTKGVNDMTVFPTVGKRKGFSIQWHITAKCDQRCKHCYASDPETYKAECMNEMPLVKCLQVIDSLVAFCQKLDANPHVVLTGGDPLLCDHFFELAEYAHSKGCIISILGNPFHLTEENLGRLKKLELRSYQISIDGLRDIHDHIRKPGSFDASIEGLKKLKHHGIRAVVMFTISKENVCDLIPVMRYVGEVGVDAFAFSRVCGFGSGKGIDCSFTPDEYRRVLEAALVEERYLKSKGIKTKYNHKDHLWVPLMTELGEETIKPIDDGVIYGGCSLGCHGFCVLADGTVFACRRFKSPIGKIPDQSVEDVFLSTEMDYYRDTKFEKCSKCELLQHCRGCPAVAYGQAGRFGAPDPQCWKEVKV